MKIKMENHGKGKMKQAGNCLNRRYPYDPKHSEKAGDFYNWKKMYFSISFCMKRKKNVP